MARTVVAIYEDFATANAAVRELVDAGFSRDNISMIANNSGTTGTTGTTGATTTGENVADETGAGAGVGAGIGAAIGGIGGLLVGLGALVIPGIGPVLAAGPLAVALSTLTGAGVGAVAGGVTGGLLGALIGLGIPQEEAEYYAEGVRRGGVLVTVQADDYNTDQILDVLNHHNPMDINERASQWRTEGWPGVDANTDSTLGSSMTGTGGMATGGMGTGAMGPGTMGTGAGLGMGVGTGTTPIDTGTSATDLGTGQHSHVASGPVDIGEDVTGNDIFSTDTGAGMGATGASFGAGTSGMGSTSSDFETSSSELREAGAGMGMSGSDLGSTETMGDAHLHRERGDNMDVSDMREQDAQMGRTHMGEEGFSAADGTDETVYRRGAAGTSDYDSFNMENPVYRSHYDTTFVDSGYPYDYYVPAYQYGYGLASDVRYQHRNWDVIERDVQHDWELEHPGTWDRFQTAIRHAWEDVSGQSGQNI